MATAPTNPIVKVAELDTILPSTQNVNKYPPDNQIATVGWGDGQFVSGEHLNYCFDNLSKWMAYLSERVGELQTQIERERVSVGEIIEITGDSRNPSVIKGYGTWESFGAGQVLVGVGSHTDDRGETKVWVDGQDEGEYKHVQTQAEMAQHEHAVSGTTNTTGSHAHDIKMYESGDLAGNRPADGNGSTSSTAVTDPAGDHNHTVSGTAANAGSSAPMNITQPSIAVYRWKRTA